jgi:two-component system catabolic regulation response regulator CreB
MLHETALDLTAHEFRLASVLVSHPNQVFSREQLLEHAWDDPGAVTDRTVDAHIKSLRAKLKNAQLGAEEMIETRRGMGYSYSLLTS